MKQTTLFSFFPSSAAKPTVKSSTDIADHPTFGSTTSHCRSSDALSSVKAVAGSPDGRTSSSSAMGEGLTVSIPSTERRSNQLTHLADLCAPLTPLNMEASDSDDDMCLGDLIFASVGAPQEPQPSDNACGEDAASILEKRYRGWAEAVEPSEKLNADICAASPVLLTPVPHHSTVAKPSHRLAQTFLDFGQNNADSCPKCGMLHAEVEEDRELHRRLCGALQQRRRGTPQRTSSKRPRTSSAAAHDALDITSTTDWLASDSVVPLLDRLVQETGTSSRGAESRATAKCTTKIPLPQPMQAPSQPSLPASPSPLTANPSMLRVYALRCGTNPNVSMLQLLDALHFAEASLDAAGYCVVIVVHERTQRLLCAVAGRPSTREQDPQLELLPRADGPPTCHTRRVLTFCDVNFLWLQPLEILAKVVSHASESSAEAMVTAKTAMRRLFGGPAEAQRRLEWCQQQAQDLQRGSLHVALSSLAGEVVYGHQLQPLEHFSFASTAVEAASAIIVLSCCLNCPVNDEGEDEPILFIHEDDEAELAGAERESSSGPSSQRNHDELLRLSDVESD